MVFRILLTIFLSISIVTQFIKDAALGFRGEMEEKSSVAIFFFTYLLGVAWRVFGLVIIWII